MQSLSEYESRVVLVLKFFMPDKGNKHYNHGKIIEPSLVR